MTGGDDAMGAGDALGSPVLEKMTVELSGINDDAVWLATGVPVLEKITVELSGFGGDGVWLTTGSLVVEKTTGELTRLEDVDDCIAANAEEEIAEVGPEATNTAVLLLVGEITATTEDTGSVAEATAADDVFDGKVTNTAGGVVTAETTVDEDREPELEVTGIEDAVLDEDVVLDEDAVLEEDAVLDIEVIETERAVLELGGSACEGSTLDVERAEAVAGPTVPTMPSIIEIVVAGLLTTIYGGVSTVIVMVVKALLRSSKYCGTGDASAVPSKYCSKHQAINMTRYMTAVP